MHALRKGCVVALGGYLALAVLYGLAIRARFPDAPVLVAPVLALFALFVLGPLKAVLVPTPWARALRRHARDPRPVDGAFSAVEGPLIALDGTLVSPLRGLPCLHYEAEIYRRERLADGGFRRWYDWTAVENAPAAVETALGRVQLVGLFLTQHVPAVELEGREVAERARRWVETATFEPKPGLGSALDLVRDLLGSDDAAPRRAWVDPDADGIRRDHGFVEKVLCPGDVVTAIGRYDAARTALVSAGGLPTEVVPGDAAEARRTLDRSQLGVLAFAILLFLVAHGMGAFVLARTS